jgi:type VI secretion system protein ImpK
MTTPTTVQRRGKLAVLLQEAFTASARLRANRMGAVDAASFRNNVKQSLTTADREARQLGYASQTVKLAVYALIVHIDECVLNSGNPAFQAWHGKPLQEEVFGDHRGGELFFENLRGLLTQPDTEELADLLEVYYLCLLLGFQGRYGGDQGALSAVGNEAFGKIQRTRGVQGDLTPSWVLPRGEKVPKTQDPWIRRIGIAAVSAGAAAVLLFLVFAVALRPAKAELRDLVETQIEAGVR